MIVKHCESCWGTGVIKHSVGNGYTAIDAKACKECNGTGHIIEVNE